MSLWKGDIRVQKCSNGEMIGGWRFAGAALASPGRDAEFVLEGGPKTKKGCCVLGDRSVTSHRREGVRDDCLAPEEQVSRGDLGPG